VTVHLKRGTCLIHESTFKTLIHKKMFRNRKNKIFFYSLLFKDIKNMTLRRVLFVNVILNSKIKGFHLI